MKKYRVTSAFIVPPENQGQIVEVSYAIAADDEVIIERTLDKSDRTIRYDAYEYPDKEWEWDPWNGTPSLGEHVGVCAITDPD